MNPQRPFYNIETVTIDVCLWYINIFLGSSSQGLCHVSLSATDDPPRPSFETQLSRDMAGYMPARADFMEVSDLMGCLLKTN